jgi:two-component system, response regulator
MILEGPILLVEDNPADVMLALRAIKKNGVMNEVLIARNGSEAFEYLYPTDGVAAKRPGVVLLDLNMPLVDGHEVLKRIRNEASTRLLPVVILTSSIEHADLEQAYGNGANGYVKKPVSFDDFVEAMRRLGDYWLGLNQPPPRSAG